MPSPMFQKYPDGMNRQPLDKTPGRQGSDGLLPHQRTSRVKKPATIKDSILQTPQNFRNGAGEHETPQEDVLGVASNVSMNTQLPHSKDSEYARGAKAQQNGTQPFDNQSKVSELQLTSPDPNHCQIRVFNQGSRQYDSSQGLNAVKTHVHTTNGLAQSRWASPSYHCTPVLNGISSPPVTPPHRIQKQQRRTVETQVAPPSRQGVDTNTHWKPAGKSNPPAMNGAHARDSRPNSSDKHNDGIQSPSWDELSETPDNVWNESEHATTQIRDSGRQPLTALAVVSATKADPEANTKITSFSSQVEVQKIGEGKFGDNVPDPRGNWPTELGIHDQVKQDMADRGRDQTSQNEKDFSDNMSYTTGVEEAIPQYVTKFIETWIMGAHVIEANFLSQKIDHHEDCDVDPFEGSLLSPVDYPATRPHELMSRNQIEMTAASSVKQFLAETARRRKAHRKTEKKARATKDIEPELKPQAEPVMAETSNPNGIQTPYHLRPATESDIEAITSIYNREVLEDHRVMDLKPIKPDDFHRIYNQCLTEEMPFVVAVEGWHGVMNASRQEIIGFSLVTAVNLGISGSYETLSSRGGKLLVIVKPEYRRKRVGTSLIDIIMANCTGWYLPKGGYQFVNFTNHWLSDRFGHNPRKWWYLEMDVMILSGDNEEKTREGDEFKWIWNFLEAKFVMILKHYDEKCFYEPRRMNWLDKLTFRCRCCALGE
ncbi:hypothetical protein F4803DRAFT_496257 [Xylaria telfairii]|nr:hypothetical protein F4803DRAFT_496257 [Xylaria telfairii]